MAIMFVKFQRETKLDLILYQSFEIWQPFLPYSSTRTTNPNTKAKSQFFVVQIQIHLDINFHYKGLVFVEIMVE